MSDAVHVGQGVPQNRLFKQIGTTSDGQPILAEYVALEPGSIGSGGGGGTASSVSIADGTTSTQKAAVDASGRIKTDGSSVTQPVSAAALPLPTGAAQDSTVAAVSTTLGTDGASPPTITGTGVRGWLRAIYEKLAGTLTVATHAVTQSGVWTVARSWTLSSATDSVDVGNFPATQPVSGTFFQATQPVSGTVGVSNFPATQPVSGAVMASQGGAPWSDNITQVGGVAVAATAKGTQGANLIPTQDAKDAGRTAITLFLDAATGVTSEALGTMSITKGGVAQIAATSYTVTAGKTLRISGLHTSVKNTSTVASDSRVRVRQAASSFSVTSPIILLNEGGTPAAVATAVGTDDTVMPDGYEVAGGQIIGISHVESATTCTVSVMLVGYEY